MVCACLFLGPFERLQVYERLKAIRRTMNTLDPAAETITMPVTRNSTIQADYNETMAIS